MPVSSEIRYLESAREMVERRDWIVPTLGYVPYFEKPILLYWLAAASQLLLGPSSVAARLPSILAGTLSLLVTWEFARRILGGRGGMRAALMTLGSGYFLVLGSVLITDTVFAACLWSAWYAWWRAREHGGRGPWKWVYCLATALGFMTKGPLALILVGGSIATFLVFIERRTNVEQSLLRAQSLRIARGLRRALYEGHVVALILVTLALNLPWTLAVLQRDPRFIQFFYVRENLRAFFDGNVHHSQNPFYYVAVMITAFTPWSLPCILALCLVFKERAVVAWRGGVAVDESRAYLGAIVLFTLAFLELSSAKLASYPLPILPAMAILVVDCWTKRLGHPPAWLRWSPLVGGLIAIAGTLVFLSVRNEDPESVPAELRDHLSVVLTGTLGSFLVAGVLALRGRFWSGIAASGVGMAVLIAIATARLEDLEIAHNLQPLAQRVAALEQPGDLVVTTSRYAQDYTLQMRMQHRIGILGPARELGMGFFAEVTAPTEPIPRNPYSVSAENLPSNPWLYTPERLAEVMRSKQRVWFIGTRKDVDPLLANAPSLRVIEWYADAGLVTNVP